MTRLPVVDRSMPLDIDMERESISPRVRAVIREGDPA
jgi:hypothetical protein